MTVNRKKARYEIATPELEWFLTVLSLCLQKGMVIRFAVAFGWGFRFYKGVRRCECLNVWYKKTSPRICLYPIISLIGRNGAGRQLVESLSSVFDHRRMR